MSLRWSKGTKEELVEEQRRGKFNKYNTHSYIKFSKLNELQKVSSDHIFSVRELSTRTWDWGHPSSCPSASMSLFQKQKEKKIFTLKEVVQSIVKSLYSREIFRLYPNPMELLNHFKAIPNKVPKSMRISKSFKQREDSSCRWKT